MNRLWQWLQRHLAPAGRPDLLLAIMSGLIAWILTLAFRAAVGH